MKRQRKWTSVTKARAAKRAKTVIVARAPSNAMQVDYQAGRRLGHTPPVELKAFDVVLGPLVSATAGTFLTLNVPVPGTDLYNRVGRKAYWKSISFECEWKPSGAVATNEMVRLILYYDSQPGGAAPALADLLKNSNGAAATTIFSHINLDNRERFQIIRNWKYVMPVVTGASDVGTNTLLSPMKDFNINDFISLKELETIYNAGTAGTVADLQSGALGLCLIGETDTGWQLNGVIRLRYYD